MAGGLVLAGCGKGSCADLTSWGGKGECEGYVGEEKGALGVEGYSCTDSSCAAWKAMKNPKSVDLNKTDSYSGNKYSEVYCDC